MKRSDPEFTKALMIHYAALNIWQGKVDEGKAILTCLYDYLQIDSIFFPDHVTKREEIYNQVIDKCRIFEGSQHKRSDNNA